MAKVEVPRNPIELLQLATRVSKKHAIDGDKSPLNMLSDEVDWTKVSGSLEECLVLHNKAEELMRQVEQLYKERDLLLHPVEEAVKKSRNFLKTAFPSNPKKLGEWGFDVIG